MTVAVLDAKPFSIAELFRPFEPLPPYEAASALSSASSSAAYSNGDLRQYAAAAQQQQQLHQQQQVANRQVAANQATSDSGRTLLLIKHKIKKRRRKRKKKRLCRSHGRTYPYVNIAYVEVNEYYNCPAGTVEEVITGGAGEQYDEEIIDEYIDPSEPAEPSNSHGPLGGSVPAGGPPVQYPEASGAGCRRGLGLCPSGGPLGFFGEGGLFDFTSGAQNQLVGLNPLQGVSYDDVRPVVEVNLPGSLVDAVCVDSHSL